MNQIKQTDIELSYIILDKNTNIEGLNLTHLEFIPYKDEIIDYQKNTKLVVFKLTPMDNIPLSQELVIVVGYKYLDEVSYIRENIFNYSKNIETMYQLKPTVNRIFSSEKFVFNFNNSPDYSHYIVIKDDYSSIVDINLVIKDEYIKLDEKVVVFLTLLYSVLMGVFFMNLIYYLYIKTKAYLYYSLYILAAIIAIFWQESRTIDYPFLYVPFVGLNTKLFYFILSNIVVLVFIYEFLKLDWRKQFTAKLIIVWSGFFSLLLLLTVVSYFTLLEIGTVGAVYNYTVQLGNLYILFVAYHHFKKGNRQAGFLLSAWIALIAISSFRVYMVLVPASNNFWYIHSYEIGLVAGSIILGLGLADQTLGFKKSSDKAQARFYKANKALFAETLVNNFLLEIKDEIYKEARVENFIKHIESHFAQMIVKYAPVENILKYTIKSSGYTRKSIIKEADNSCADGFLEENKPLIYKSCKEDRLLVKNHTREHSHQESPLKSIQIIVVPVSLDYNANKAEFECLILEIKAGKQLSIDEIKDLQVFIDKSIVALMDSQQLKQITKHAQNIISQAADKDKKMRIKDRFFTNVSHEFRTPLTLTIGPLKDLHEQREELTANGRYLVDTALSNAQDLMLLVDSILDVQKLEAKKFPLKVTKVNLNNLIYRVLKKLINWSLDHGQTLVFDKNKQQDFYIYCDKKEVEKVLVNLVSNAIKYSGNDSKIIISINYDDDWMKIKTLDNGIGIASELKDRVFERYFQGDSIQHLSEAGTGIGLSYVKDVMELHHGKITLESNLGEGSEFTLWFKQGFAHFEYEEMSDSEDKNAIQQNQDKSLQCDKIDGIDAHHKDLTTLLIVEDNPELLKFLVFKFKNHYKILEAKNGLIGLNKATKFLPDLIISDVMMPVMDGFEMLLALRENNALKTIPVVLLTAMSNNVGAIEGLETGADDYVTKPFDFNELKARVDRLIASKKAIREENIEQFMPSSPVEKSAFQEKLEEAIIKNISDTNLNVERLAEMLYFERTGLYRKIKSEFNMTPIAYIRKLRMELAKKLLLEKKITVSETAYACGYDSLSYFSKQFKKTYGHSPSEVS